MPSKPNLDPNVRRRHGSYKRCQCVAPQRHLKERRVREQDRFQSCSDFPRERAKITVQQCTKCGKAHAYPSWPANMPHLRKLFPF